MLRILVLSTLACQLLACAVKDEGAEGGPCYGNGTCDPGLVCLSNLCVKPADAGQDAGPIDLPKADAKAIDQQLPDQPSPDLLKADRAPDTSKPDLAIPDLAVPDLPVPDTPSPDQLVPDLPSPDLLIPDAALPDSTSPDILVTSYKVATLAGNGKKGFADGPAGSAMFAEPEYIAVDSMGKVYVADHYNHRIRVISAGKVSTFAGTGVKGMLNGPVASAKFDSPRGIAVDNKDQLYVSDCGNNRIRVISKGVVTTLAGSGVKGFKDGPAASAKFFYPRGIYVDDPAKGVYIVDSDNHRIRKIVNGVVSTIAGSGTAGQADGPAASAQFYYPKDIARTSAGAFLVADSYPHKIRVIAGGKVSTYAGTGAKGFKNGPSLKATFAYPYGVAVGKNGEVLIGDHQNHAIRMIAGGLVSTLAGSGTKGFKDGPAKAAMFQHPVGIAVDKKTGKIYVADPFNNRVRVLIP